MRDPRCRIPVENEDGEEYAEVRYQGSLYGVAFTVAYFVEGPRSERWQVEAGPFRARGTDGQFLTYGSTYGLVVPTRQEALSGVADMCRVIAGHYRTGAAVPWED